MTRTDENINFNWTQAGLMIIPNLARDYVSIHWTGFLHPSESGSYLFEVEYDDAFRLVIDEVVLVDSLTDSDNVTTVISDPMTLTANHYHKIDAYYY